MEISDKRYAYPFTKNYETILRENLKDLNKWRDILWSDMLGYILSPCLFNLCAEYIMRNATLNEAQAGVMIAGRNINNIRYADDTTLMAESEELKSLLMKVKQGE